MSTKKFLSLIYGKDAIHLAPNAKVIPADVFSKIVDAQEMLARVKEDAERYRKEVITECEKLKEIAQKEGFEAGFKHWAEHIADLEKEIKEVRAEFEKIVLPVALKAAKKIVGKELEVSKSAILDIVTSTLKAVAQHKKIAIFVNKEELEVLNENRQKIKEVFENLETLSLGAREDIAPGGCIIETERGIINAQIENRWKLLEGVFESIAKPLVKKEVDEEPAKNP
ncbi:HrpE/YscL family type III secretion apparatus protein [Parachlamydia sp. AcF125]|uniref:HrpE/YscL family type III secretion apparatus protein n=1 Tax=Parachlamydia sp. AcF125 TaxID=2795736 RepID=UPI001BC96C56|nr:Yop proteins translocation protein L [Parachlamydia sp. AcF125]